MQVIFAFISFYYEDGKYTIPAFLNNEGFLLIFILYSKLLERGKKENWGVEFVWVTPGATTHPPPFAETCKQSIAQPPLLLLVSNLLSGPIAGSSVERPRSPVVI